MSADNGDNKRRREEAETLRSDEAARKKRFSRWDGLQEESRGRMAPPPPADVEEETPQVPSPPPGPKRSELSIRLERARLAAENKEAEDRGEDTPAD